MYNQKRVKLIPYFSEPLLNLIESNSLDPSQMYVKQIELVQMKPLLNKKTQ